MEKTNLPVIVLRGIILLPNNEIRLEFDNDESKNIIDVSELFHDNNILVVSIANAIEETLDYKKLPKHGVIAKIGHKMELPNGKVRVILTGKYRADVLEYINMNKKEYNLESIVSKIDPVKLEEVQEKTLIKKLYKEVENYVNLIPYVSNSILSLISACKKLDKMTDIIETHLEVNNERLVEYLEENNSLKRLEMIINDIYQEEEIFKIEKEVDLKVKRTIDDTQKEFLLREKIKAIKEELGDITLKDDEETILREKIDKLNAPNKIKDRLHEELRRYESLSQTSPELNVVRNYIDWLLQLPWNNKKNEEKDLLKIKNSLDETHEGLEEIKVRIIEYLACKQRNKDLKSPIICLVGPPGVGKTSLAYSISKAINKDFAKISVGGINDEAELIGHRKTYLGASPGRIIQGLKKAKSSNPVFLIDEIDKMTKDYKGDPASILLEILDPEQNKYFSDNFIEEEVDLSDVMFITTANDINSIPEPLKDRLEIINLSSYTEYEKLEIFKHHLLPKICNNYKINKSGIDISDNTILKIIRNYTKEAGVRELERQLDKIIRKIVTDIVTKKIIINKIIIKELKQYLGNEKYIDLKPKNNDIGIVNGLAYTKFGGDVLPIETTIFKGSGKLILTGSLGDVMKESATIAIDYIKANYKKYNVDYETIINNDIHIHVPEGAIPKEGPSAGIALTSSLLSTLLNKKISNKIAMTGEITLTGKVLPIGGLKEKVIGAYKNNIKKIIIPKDNINDLDEINDNIKSKIQFILVNNYEEVWNNIKDVK